MRQAQANGAIRMPPSPSGSVIGTILRYDARTTSYKIALLRAINDVVLAFPDVDQGSQRIAVPLRLLAEFWIAYYWPFVDPGNPIWQGPRNRRRQGVVNDMAFRPHLARLRASWESAVGASSRPADGYLVINEFRVPRKRRQYPPDLIGTYEKALSRTANTIRMPIRYAGAGEWSVFDKPTRFDRIVQPVTRIPGTRSGDACLVMSADLWNQFQHLSLWVEALCIHEWSLFVERVNRPTGAVVDRGDAYRILTQRPDNRRPLTWERNQIDLLIMEGHQFMCPWTQRRIDRPAKYDLDHIIPVSVYPINELWNLVPSDPYFNQHTKRDRLPSQRRLDTAEPILTQTYDLYCLGQPLRRALAEDAGVRFARVLPSSAAFSRLLARSVVTFIDRVAESRNSRRFK